MSPQPGCKRCVRRRLRGARRVSAPPVAEGVVFAEAFVDEAAGRGDLAGGELEMAVQVALGGREEAAVELLAEQAGLLPGPVGGEQHVGEFRVAQ